LPNLFDNHNIIHYTLDISNHQINSTILHVYHTEKVINIETKISNSVMNLIYYKNH